MTLPALGAFPKQLTHRQPDSMFHCLEHEAARQGQRAETGRLKVWEIKTQLRRQSDQVWTGELMQLAFLLIPWPRTRLELQAPVRMTEGGVP